MSMDIVIDRKKLFEMLKEFHNITGIRISFIEDYEHPIMGMPGNNCALCEYKQRDMNFYNRCKKCDSDAMKVVNETQELYIYQCHYHLVEALLPVKIYEKTIGYFTLGQIISDKSSFIENNNPTDYEMELLNQLQIISRPKLTSAAQILSWLAQYTVLDKLIDRISIHSFDAVKNYIDNNFSENITIDFLCKKFHYSRSSLFTLFKTNVNMGINEYITLTRLKRAKELLKTYKINQVTEMIGITDNNYFSRLFKKTYNISPSAYSKSFKQNE